MGSGGGEDPGAGDGEPAPEPLPAPDEPTCGEEPLGTFHCEAREVACEADSDCPTDWTCQENYSRPVCGGASIDPAEPQPPTATCPAEMTAIARICEDGSTGKPVCVDGAWEHVCPEDEAAEEEPAPEEIPPPDDCGIDDSAPERVCAPPFHDLGWGGFGIATSADGAAESGASGIPLSDPGAPSEEPRADDGATAGGDEDQNNISMGSGETGMDPEADSGGGCAVSAAGTSRGASAGVLALLGACLLGVRRRRRG
jgi:MYXO-CTERM domain-containing protein